eukprot:CAMPEP_0113634990 /NCGR_PEP_ID=MMETSP0017_2-20120614/18228_1 /TAXON_ID=2856 /ORGANISM="Cylindrotheca closterium" /LENGTH=591 /DNA_ID=CAMNT_0000545729 /DNA_START=155 /DNA_END=1930 /DNA_ORIENTATION=+ /assembly_acc=CAM_ASM_000147
MSDNRDQPSLEFDIDAILASNPNPLSQPAAAASTQPPPVHQRVPTPVAYPDLITADALDDQHTISTLGRDQSLLTRDDPPIAMFRPSYDPDKFADEEAPSLPKYSYKQTIRNTASGEALRTLGSGENHPNPSLSNTSSSGSNRSASYRDLYIIVIVMSLLLLAIITGLAIWLIALKTNETYAAGTSIEEESVWVAPTLTPTRTPTRFDFVATTAPTMAPTIRIENTAAPTTTTTAPKEPTRPPTVAPTTSPKTPLPTAKPTELPTLAPTVAETPSPTPLPTPESIAVQRARTKFLQVLESQSVSAATTLGRLDTPQFHAFDWLIKDPNFETYSNERLLQRWTLATFALGLQDADWEDTAMAIGRSGFRTLPEALHTWVQYTDECTWFFTQKDGAELCNDQGLYHRIDLRSQNLAGTIPTEIALLSNHLAFIYLYDNEIHGTLPTELAQLSRLERVELTRNDITGPLPSELGNLSKLVFLGLGVNDMSGPLPSEMGKLDILRTIGLERNQFRSTIPTEWGNMVEARLLNLDRNQLTGTVPYSLWHMTLLRGLNLSFNSGLVGTIPYPLCEQRLNYLEANCENVDCPCCTTCH